MASQPQFGGYAAQLSPQRTAPALPTATPEDYGAGVGDALTGAGRIAGDIALDRRRLETEREYDRQAMAAMSDWASVQEKYGVADNEARANPAARGAAGHTKAMSELAEKMGEEFLGTITHEGLREQYRARVADWSGNRLVDADAFERGQTAKLGADQAEITVDRYTNQVRGQPLNKYIEKLAEWRTAPPPMGVPQDIWARMVREGDQKITVGWLRGQEPEARRAVLDARTFDDLLTPEQIDAIGNEADRDIAVKQRQAEAAARDAKADAIGVVDDVRDRIQRGYPVTDEEYASAVQLTKDYELDERGRDLAAGYVGKRMTEEYRTARIDQIGADLQKYETAIAKAGDKAKPELIERRNWLRDELDRRRKAENTDPQSLTAQFGIDMPDIDFSQPESIRAAAQARRQLEARTGKPAPPFRPERAEILVAQMGTPQGKMAVANVLRAMARAGDGAGALQGARQLAPNDRLFSYSLGLDPAVQQSVLRGQVMVSEHPVPKDPALKEWRAATATAMRNMPAAFREDAYQATVALYRQAAAARGKEEFDPLLFRGALREALGGSVQNRTGGIGEWNDTAMMLPGKMTQQQVEAAIWRNPATRDARRRDGSKIEQVDLLKNYTPRMVRSGVYRFVNKNEEYVAGPNGVLEVDVSAPVTSPRAIRRADPLGLDTPYMGARR